MRSREQLTAEIARMYARAEALREDALRADEAPPILHRVLAELHTSVVELRACELQLREQNSELLRASAALERERRHHAALFEEAPVAYVLTDARSVLRQINRACARLLQQPVATLVGKPFASLVHADDRERWRSFVEQLQLGEEVARPASIRLRFEEHDVRVRIDGTPLAEDHDYPGGWRWVLEDVDAREHVAEVDRLTADARRKDEFLAMLGHELRNPLAPIRAAVELWRHHAGRLTEEERQWTVDVVSRQADHLAHLVDELLDVSRVTHGKITLRRAPLDLREIVEQARDVVQAQAQQHRLELHLPRAAVVVDGDAVRLRQVVVNLLDNAIKFTPRDGRIVVRVAIDGEHARLRVRDHGLGIAPELLDRVFGMFSQGEQTLVRGTGGLGLGLPLVRQLVELHGGTVTVASEGIGHGSAFEVVLPRAGSPAPAKERPIDALRGLARLRLLLVDDNVDAAQTLGTLLEATGHEATLAFDGTAAMEAFEQQRPDAVLLDLALPDIDGFEVARRMQAIAPGIPIIAITGYGDDRVRAKVRESGFVDHLLKPVELDALRRALETLDPRTSA